jgi:hypothetical protein
LIALSGQTHIPEIIMAKLGPFFGTHDGDQKIYVGVFSVGTGTFPKFSDYQASFDGSYEAFGQSGTFDIQLTLTDHDATAKSGPCSVTLNGKVDNKAKYQASAKKLTVTTALNDQPIDIYGKQGGTQVDNISSHNLWIGQWG